MRISKTLKNLGFAIGFLSMTVACETPSDKPEDKTTEEKQETTEGNAELTIHEISDPDGMNPIISNAANALYIQNNIYSKLLVYDQQTLELSPQLAVGRPEIKALEDGEYAGGMSLTYEIHPEATWDNGTPITAEDYIFTIKVIKNPRVNSAQIRPYFEFMDKVEIDPTNNKKFTVYSKERYFRAEESSGQEPFILPEYHYDSEGLMSQFTIEQLSDPEQMDALMKDQKIMRFAEQFNAPKFKRVPEAVVGSGPYQFVEWTTGQRVVLERKKDWWGDKVKGNKMLEAYPPKIIYKTIPDLTAAITNAKDGQVDVIRSIQPTKFIDLKDDPKFSSNFDLSTPDQFAYYYIGFNMKKPQFRDKRVRRAIAHLIDRDEMIESIFEGMAIKTNGPINPKKPYYNKNMPDIEYNIEKAKELLKEAGWADADGDNIMDKKIDGKQVRFSVEYKYQQGNIVRKNIGQLLKDEASRVGIEVNLTPVDFSTLLEDADKRNFDMVALAWVKTPGLDDMKQVWHTAADKEGGANRVGFGTAESDKLIDEIRVTLDPEVRKELYLKVQEIIYEEQPYVFLFVPSELIAIHNRFDGTETSPMRPGYREASFKLRK
ncbi:ABC transporter substrate-binding protein [Aureispira sp. CCB-QB1]|uniref:ABC transporter substrate-binding protein n=1 Tax=Aureispira sp. CCB-QB1 TaxID=1313421 RepID=UPI00069838BD|nr:ABC transporter substrate-binding protein [Aureispira sp. CCB-QB1]